MQAHEVRPGDHTQDGELVVVDVATVGDLSDGMTTLWWSDGVTTVSRPTAAMSLVPDTDTDDGQSTRGPSQPSTPSDRDVT